MRRAPMDPHHGLARGGLVRSPPRRRRTLGRLPIEQAGSPSRRHHRRCRATSGRLAHDRVAGHQRRGQRAGDDAQGRAGRDPGAELPTQPRGPQPGHRRRAADRGGLFQSQRRLHERLPGRRVRGGHQRRGAADPGARRKRPCAGAAGPGEAADRRRRGRGPGPALGRSAEVETFFAPPTCPSPWSLPAARPPTRSASASTTARPAGR